MTSVCFGNKENSSQVNFSDIFKINSDKTPQSEITKKVYDVIHSTISSSLTSNIISQQSEKKLLPKEDPSTIFFSPLSCLMPDESTNQKTRQSASLSKTPSEEVLATSKSLLDFLNTESNDVEQAEFIKSIPNNILGDAVQYIFKTLVNKETKTKLYRLLFLNFHSFEDYFVFLENYRYILPAGVRIVVEYLQKNENPDRKPTIDLPCTVFDHPNDLVQHVINSDQKKEDLPELLITCCRTIQGPIGKHITPLLLKKVDSKNAFLIWTDSISYYDNLSNEFSKIKTGLRQKGIKLHIFYLTSVRQRSATDCSIFSLHDAINFSIHHKTILSECSKQVLASTSQETVDQLPCKDKSGLDTDSSSDEEDFDAVDPTREPDVYPLLNLPHRFFWLTHKQEVADELLKTLNQEEQAQFQKKYQQHCVTLEDDKIHNLRSKMLSRKFEGIIWNTIISRS